MIHTRFIVDDSEVQALLGRLEFALSSPSLSDFLRAKAVPHFQERANSRFESEGDNASGAWAELAWSTQQIREDQGYGGQHPINRRTNELHEFMTSDGGDIRPMAAGAFLSWPSIPEGELGAKYKTAQQGLKNPKTPARPVAAVDVTDLEWLLSGLADWIATEAGVEFN